MTKHKFIVDATIYNSNRLDGLNRYTKEIIKELLNKDYITCYTADLQIKNEFKSKVNLVDSNIISKNNFKGNLRRFVWHQFRLPQAIKEEHTSLFYSPVCEGMVFPACSQIITIHDILPILYPDTFPRLKYYFRYIVPKLIRASKEIITVSESTKRDLGKYYKLFDKPIHVVYQGYRDSIFFKKTPDEINFIKKKYRLGNYILSVGETRPYKNIRRLIEAFSKVSLPSLDLIIVGKTSKLDDDLVQLPKILGINEKVRFLGYVPDDELASLYSGAKAFLFPSLYEGFGIPPLEAMASGSPTIVSKVSSIPEVCGDSAYYIDPYNVESIAKGIYSVCTNESLQMDLSMKGIERAKLFSYKKAADRLISIFDKYVD